MLDDGTYRLTLIALHVEPGWRQWTPLLGEHTTPALIYEVVAKQDVSDAEPVYEGRIIEPSGGMIHNEPYRSTLLEPLAAWWSRETETDPPPELTPANTGKSPKDRKHSGKSRQTRRRG